MEEYLQYRVHETGVSHIEEPERSLSIVPLPVESNRVQRFDCFRWLRSLDGCR